MKKSEIPCPVCNSSKYKVLYEDTLGDRFPVFNYDFSINFNLTYRIVKCLDCTHHYASPRHDNLYANYDGNTPDSIYLTLQPQRIQTDKEVIKEVLKHTPSGKLLDVGCATGDFLSEAQKHYQAEGLELSTWSTKMARERGFTIHQCLLEKMNLPESFDVVTLWGVIEHFEYPFKEIGNINKLLKKGGTVALWTGDIDSLFPKIIGKKWWYFQGQHIQMFTGKSMEKLFSDNGFSTIYMGRYPYIITPESINNSLRRYPILHAITKPIFNSGLFNNFKIKLPGEMFAIFRKV